MLRLLWFWHRLGAMGPGEIWAHVRRKTLQWSDARHTPDQPPALTVSVNLPILPQPEDAPASLREALANDARDILAGRWKAFGHLAIQVSDPPEWHTDYLVGKNLATDKSAFKLNHRELPGGADIKLIWELSRWQQLTRLAMAAYVLGDERAAVKCVEWLGDWLRHNPPYHGWNWTSALEAGMRLVQFTWIDALLGSALLASNRRGSTEGRTLDGQARDRALGELRREILPAHVRFVWRYRSVGSSANNHLLGELAGVILAVARWPALAKYAAPLDRLQRLWQREVLAQFAEDGGNREQALNYHLFSWEFCWHASAALSSAGRKLSGEVADRLRRAAQFFVDVQVPSDPWDYGDSDNAFVTPAFSSENRAIAEWHAWFESPGTSPTIDYWWAKARLDFGNLLPDGSEWRFSDKAPGYHWDSKNYVFARSGTGKRLTQSAREKGKWKVFHATGVAVRREGPWQLRIDASPLGYPKTAAHGHLDALHFSIWFQGVALVIDPGTGVYYSDSKLREWLAARSAHNSPCPAGWESWPRRVGPFLWAHHHSVPRVNVDFPEPIAGQQGKSIEDRLFARMRLGKWGADPPNPYFRRTIKPTNNQDGWIVEDEQESSWPFSVRWQFGPGARLESIGARTFRVTRNRVVLEIQVSGDWAGLYPVVGKDSGAFTNGEASAQEAQFAGTVSPAFRRVEWAPYLKLVARPGGDKTCVCRTTFLACRGS